MKRIFLLLTCLAFVFGNTYAQYELSETAKTQPEISTLNDNAPTISLNDPKMQYSLQQGDYSNSSSRAVTVQFELGYWLLDWFTYDPDLNIGNGTNGYNPNIIARLHTSDTSFRVNPGSKLLWAASRFDTLIDYINTPTAPFTSYPVATSTITIDSIQVDLNHQNNTGTTDSIWIKVFSDDFGYNIIEGAGGAATILWDTIITTDTSLSDVSSFSFLFVPVNYTLPTGETFQVQVEFYGDTANECNIGYAYYDPCGTCVAEPTIVGEHTFTYAQRVFNTGQTDDGFFWEGIFFDCDGSTTETPGGCEANLYQNYRITPYLTVDAELNVDVSAAVFEGCASDVIDVTSLVTGFAGSNTFSWTPTDNILGSSTDSIVSILVGDADETYTLMVIDGNNDTATTSFTIDSRQITVDVLPDADTITNCFNPGIVITAQVGGDVVGASYLWNNDSTQPNLTDIQFAGSYVVTVANSFGCTATDGSTISLGPGFDISLGFSSSGIICQNQPAVITQSSTPATGWSFNWLISGLNDVTRTTSGEDDLMYTFPDAGDHDITLTANKSGCKVILLPSTEITVLAESNSQCATGIDDVDFAKFVNVFPNPTTGNLVIEGNVGEINANAIDVTVYNINGEAIRVISLKNEGAIYTTVDLSNEAQGVYFVRLTNGENTAVKKVILAK